MPNPQRPEGVGGLPRFAPVDQDDPLSPDAVLSHPVDPSIPASPGPSRESPPSPPPGKPDPDPPRTSSPISSELGEGIESVAGGLFFIAGTLLNKFVRKRTKSNTRAWIPTEAEADAFAAPAARLAGKAVPEELRDGDAAAYLEMGTVVVSYGMRNAMGVTDEQINEAQGRAPGPAEPEPRPAPAPVYAEPPSAPPPRTASVGSSRIEGVAEATPPPPSVIDPSI